MNLDLKKALDLYVGGVLIILLRPLVVFLGKVLGRDHSPIPKGDITVIKLLGGGSLVIGLPALYAIKNKYPNQKLQILTTKSIVPFAKTLNVFDEYLIIDDTSLFKLLTSSLTILKKLFRTDTILDWEVYSRLTTIFALFTCARNRMGFYREDVKSRTNFSTHLVFFNLYYGSWYFYEELSRLMGCEIPPIQEVRKKFLAGINAKQRISDEWTRIGFGHCCSDLSKERMLSAQQWKSFASSKLDPSKKYKFYFFGAPADKAFGDEIGNKLLEIENIQIQLENRCGKTKLNESIEEMAAMDEFWAIDSALLHYARLMGLKLRAFFGPTSPQSLIKPFEGQEEELIYKQLPCSPCVHATETPPCKGNNKCIQDLFGPYSKAF